MTDLARQTSTSLYCPLLLLGALLSACGSGGNDSASATQTFGFPEDPFEAPEQLPADHFCVRWGSNSDGYCFDVSQVLCPQTGCDIPGGHEFYDILNDPYATSPGGSVNYYVVQVSASSALAIPCEDCVPLEADCKISTSLKFSGQAPYTPENVSLLNLNNCTNLTEDDLYWIVDETSASLTLSDVGPTRVAGRGFATTEHYKNPSDKIDVEWSFNIESRTDD